MIMELGSNSCI